MPLPAGVGQGNRIRPLPNPGPGNNTGLLPGQAIGPVGSAGFGGVRQGPAGPLPFQGPRQGGQPISNAMAPPGRNPYMQGPGTGGNGFVSPNPGLVGNRPPGSQPPMNAGPGMRPMPNQPPAPGRQFPNQMNAGPGVAPMPNQQPGGAMAGGGGPKPLQTGETQAGYDKRAGNWQMSQDRLASVGIKGGVNNATPKQLAAFQAKYGKMPAGYKGGTASAKPSPQATAGLASGRSGAGAKPRELQAR